MRVDPSLGVTGTSAASPRRAGGTGFSLNSTADTSQPAKTGAAAPMVALDSLLAIQAEQDATAERRKRAVRRGHSLLDALDALKLSVLSGRLEPGDLLTIKARLMEERGHSGDPRLDEIIAHIELRAEVELAKLTLRSRSDGERA